MSDSSKLSDQFEHRLLSHSGTAFINTQILSPDELNLSITQLLNR